jgi:hypothetical protein
MSATTVIGFFADEGSFLAACRAQRADGLPTPLAYAPYPVHGLEDAMGHPRSLIGRVVFAAVLLAAAGILAFFVQSSVQEWPINVSGKPYLSIAFWAVPILETALLAGTVVNLLACFHACKLVPGDCQVVDPRLTDDRFALVVPVAEGHGAEALTGWLSGHGAIEIRQEAAHG